VGHLRDRQQPRGRGGARAAHHVQEPHQACACRECSCACWLCVCMPALSDCRRPHMHGASNPSTSPSVHPCPCPAASTN
jgi:hypothetical protein